MPDFRNDLTGRRATWYGTGAVDPTCLAAVAELSDEALLVLDQKGLLRESTGRTGIVWGGDDRPEPGCDFRQMLEPADRAMFDALVRAPLGDQDGRIYFGRLMLHCPDGRIRPMEAKIRNRLDEPGVDAVIVALRDVEQQIDTARDLADREAVLHSVLDTMVEGVLQIDGEGRIVDVNPAAESIFATTRSRLVGQSVHALIDTPGHLELDKAILSVLNERGRQGGGLRCRLRGLRRHGVSFPLELGVSGFWLGGKPIVVLTARDGTEDEAASQALKRSEERFALAAEAANDGLWDWWTASPVAYFGARFEALLGFPAQPVEASLDHWFTRVYQDDFQRLEAALEGTLNGEIRNLEVEIRMRHADGVFRWFLARGLGIHNDMGEVERIVGSITDITGRKHAEERAAYMALHDGLTGLPNRQLLLDRIEQTLQRRERSSKRVFALMVADLDRFRIVNESLGHHVGDQILMRLAERLQGGVRRGDTVARIGGDQFAILIDELRGSETAIDRAEEMRALIARSIGAPGMDGIRLDCSIGMRSRSAEVGDATDLLRDAMLAMQEAKRKGGNCCVEFFPDLKVHVLRAYRYESELRVAIRDGGIEAFYQPIIDIATRVPVGFEALARLRLPSGELASPADFIPVAEETGLIAEVARLVVGQSVSRIAEWKALLPQLQPLTVSVNLSPKQFERQDVVTDIRRAVARAGVLCEDLKIEVTESALMQNPTTAASILADLKALGVQIGIDDFGTGYSSLSYLREFEFDFLKVDQSFTRRLQSTRRDQELVRTIVQLGQNIGMGITAEGVEKEEQLTILGALGCNYAQGFLFSRALPAEEATKWLLANAKGVGSKS